MVAMVSVRVTFIEERGLSSIDLVLGCNAFDPCSRARMHNVWGMGHTLHGLEDMRLSLEGTPLFQSHQHQLF